MKHPLSCTQAPLSLTKTASLKSRADPWLLLTNVVKSPHLKTDTTVLVKILTVSFTTASSGVEAPHEDDKLKTPLYDGADVSVLDSYLLTYQFILKHGLSKVALDELIRLLITHLPRSSKAVTSLHTLEKYFSQSLEITRGS